MDTPTSDGVRASRHPGTGRADELPAHVREHLRLAQDALAGHGPFTVSPLKGGQLNHIILLQGSTATFVLRSRRGDAREAVATYLGLVYEQAHLRELGGVFRLRSFAEEMAFAERVRDAGLRPPAVVARGTDWVALEYIRGRTLAEALKDSGCPAVVVQLLHALVRAHRHGLILGDRWGYNEIVDEIGDIRFIDFDVEWLPYREPHGLREMDMGTALFWAFLHSTRREELVETMREGGVPLLRQAAYDLGRVAYVVAGHLAFYLNPNKPTSALALSASQYQAVADPLSRLLELLARRDRAGGRSAAHQGGESPHHLEST